MAMPRLRLLAITTAIALIPTPASAERDWLDRATQKPEPSIERPAQRRKEEPEPSRRPAKPKPQSATIKGCIETEKVFNETLSGLALETLVKFRQSSAGQAAGRISEMLGEVGADQWVKKVFPVAERAYWGKGSGVLDLAYLLTDGSILVIEAKGGGGKIGTRRIAAGAMAEQGSAAYLRSVLENMLTRGSETELAAQGILKRLKIGKVRYILTESTIAKVGGDVVIKVKEFSLKEPCR
jgi:hypothetical protein